MGGENDDLELFVLTCLPGGDVVQWGGLGK